MTLFDALTYDAAVALMEFRAGWLDGFGEATGYTGERGDGDKEIITFRDGSRLERYPSDGVGLYWVIRPNGDVVTNG